MNVYFCSSSGKPELVCNGVDSLESTIRRIRSDLSERMPFYKDYNLRINEVDSQKSILKDYKIDFGGGSQYYMVTQNSEAPHPIDFTNVDWEDNEKLSYLQRRIIVHSILYYEMDSSIISDRQFDVISRQLVQMMDQIPLEECEKSRYWYMMHNFDGTTGFDLYSRLNPEDKIYLLGLARIVLENYNASKEV